LTRPNQTPQLKEFIIHIFKDFGITTRTTFMKKALPKRGSSNMVANRITELTEDELTFMEDLLLTEFSKEAEKAKTWKSKNHYQLPHGKQNRILSCLSAVRSQKQLKKTLATKW
jgi:hypothetical protein